MCSHITCTIIYAADSYHSLHRQTIPLYYQVRSCNDNLQLYNISFETFFQELHVSTKTQIYRGFIQDTQLAFILSLLEPVVPITERLTRRPQRSWQDRILDAHLGNGSNEERETIREHESHAPSPSAYPKERYKFKGEI